VTSVSNDQAKVVLAGEIDAGFYVLLFSGYDNVVTIKPSGASRGFVTSGRRAAGIVGPISPKIGNGLIYAKRRAPKG